VKAFHLVIAVDALHHGVPNGLDLGVVEHAGLHGLGGAQLVAAVAPGFTGEQLQLTVGMTRVIMLGVVLHAGSNVASGVLQGMRRFVAFSASPVLYNLGLIVGIVALVPALGPIGLAWGVVLGALGHLSLTVTAAVRAGWRPRWYWAWRDADVREVWKLMLPRTFGLAANQMSLVVTTAVASSLAAGSLTQLTWADNLQNVPTNVFGLPLAVATFPVLAQASAANADGDFASILRQNLRRILFLVVPVAAMLVTLRAHVVRLVLVESMSVADAARAAGLKYAAAWRADKRARAALGLCEKVCAGVKKS
jgi:putative peptidoglycan lipid II flippase